MIVEILFYVIQTRYLYFKPGRVIKSAILSSGTQSIDTAFTPFDQLFHQKLTELFTNKMLEKKEKI